MGDMISMSFPSAKQKINVYILWIRCPAVASLYPNYDLILLLYNLQC